MMPIKTPMPALSPTMEEGTLASRPAQDGSTMPLSEGFPAQRQH